MSKVQNLRSLVNQRLSTAAEEIFELFERTISEYEDEIRRSREENERQRRLLEAVFNPKVHLSRTDAHQPMMKGEILPQQQEENSSLNQENPAEPAHVKEEQQEVWSSQVREQLQEPQEADVSTFLFTPVHVKSEEDDKEQPQCFQLDEKQSEESRGCRGSEADRDFNPHSHLQTFSSDKTSQNDSEDHDSLCDWEETLNILSKMNPLQRKDGAAGESNSGDTPVNHSEGSSGFRPEEQLQTEESIVSFGCLFCGKRFSKQQKLSEHMLRHTRVHRFSCSVCKKGFHLKGELEAHMRVHTGEKPFSCSVCGKRFALKQYLRIHLPVHTGEKPYSCSVCGKSFTQHANMRRHMSIHTGEKPFSCDVCDQRFTQYDSVRRHKLAVHKSASNPNAIPNLPHLLRHT